MSEPQREVARPTIITRLAPGHFYGTEHTWTARLTRVAAERMDWIDRGLLVSSSVLGKRWGFKPSSLERATGDGELFSVKVRERLWYPRVFMDLAINDVAQICKALGALDDVSKFRFWQEKHDALGGLTAAQALIQGRITDALAAALAAAKDLCQPQI